MKVKIITLHGSHNYGAMLQAFALTDQIASMGKDASVIDYLPESISRGNSRIKWSRKPGVLYRSIRAMRDFGQWKKRYRTFEDFKVSKMNLTRHYPDLDELQRDPPDADVYICGSDQIWNPEKPFRAEYFLEFGGEEVRRLSYAASFGVSSIPADRILDLGRHLRNFSAISVREKEGQKIVEDADYSADVVVDPTLLLDRERWSRIASPFHATDQYILTYCLEASEEFDRVLRALSDETGLPVYHIPGPTVIKSKPIHRVMRSAGPAEFLGLFQNASYVVTNSFHGTAFALNLGKPLVGLKHTSRNSRMSTLLESLGWPDSQVDSATGIADIKALAHERSQQIGPDEMEKARTSSIKFLQKNLS